MQSHILFFPALSLPLPLSLTASVHWFYFFCQSCFLFLFQSLFAVNTEQRALNVAGTEDFFRL